ncbi:MAG: tetratricopeptide repeat protein [Spirochaetes bacterium]|nr:tetratricopeptide repeat protein [Spirochaetota bacterium]
MKDLKIIFIIVLLFVSSCFKSREQKKIELENAGKLVKKADLLFYKNDFTSALKLFLEAKDLNLEDPLLNYKIAFCYDKGQDKTDHAEKYYLRALKKLDKNKDLSVLASVYFNLGLIHSKRNEIGDKTEYFNLFYSAIEKIQTAGMMNGEDRFRLAYYYMDKGRSEDALKLFREAIDEIKIENPNHFYYAGGYFNIGIIYWRQEDVNTALYYWKRALKIDPDNEQYKMWYKKAMQLKMADNL